MMKGWKLADVFIEAGVSGSVPLAERPEGRRLLEAVSKGAVVITAKLDRMFRSAADALVTLEKHFSGVSTRYLLAPNARLELFRVFPALA